MTSLTYKTMLQTAGRASRGQFLSLDTILRALARGEHYVSGIVTPIGAVTPNYVGELYLDTVAVAWYKATALTTADWAPIGIDNVPVLGRSLTALTQANLENLAATPIELVAAPGAGYAIMVHSWRFRTIFVSTAFDDAGSDGNLILKYAGGATLDAAEADGLVDAAANTQMLSGNLTELIVAETALDNKAVQISNDGAEFTVSGGGNSTAEVEVIYSVLTTDPA